MEKAQAIHQETEMRTLSRLKHHSLKEPKPEVIVKEPLDEQLFREVQAKKHEIERQPVKKSLAVRVSDKTSEEAESQLLREAEEVENQVLQEAEVEDELLQAADGDLSRDPNATENEPSYDHPVKRPYVGKPHKDVRMTAGPWNCDFDTDMCQYT